jgi:hypothetical protein
VNIFSRFWCESRKERDHLDRSMGSEWILRRLAGKVQRGSSWHRIGQVAGSCKYDDEPAGSGAMDLVRYNLGGGA